MNADSLSSVSPPPFRSIVHDAIVRARKERAMQSVTLKETLHQFEQPKVRKVVRKTTDKWHDNLFGESYRVNACGRPDDAVYKQYAILQERLTRGFTVIRRSSGKSKDTLPLGVLVSFRKFYGRSVNDDDDDDKDCAHGTAVDASARTFIVTEKANGEMMHVYWLAAETAWVVGSKNRKLLVRNESDLQRYGGDEHLRARPMALEWLRSLARLGVEKVAALQQFLAETELTLTFEYECTEHQHIILLEKTRLVLIGLTSIMQPTGLHPAVTYAVARFFNHQIDCVAGDLCEYRIEQLDETCEQIATQRWDIEGAVLYFLDSKKRVCDMKKVKTQRYVWQRAVREKVSRHLKDRALLLCREQTLRRLDELKRAMRWPRLLVERFKRLSVAFIDWFFLEKLACGGDAMVEYYKSQYPALWHEFLSGDTLLNQSSLLSTDLNVLPEPSDVKAPLLVLPQGIPGIGKNYVYERLAKQLREHHSLRVAVVAQDDFVAEHGAARSGEACFQHVMQLMYGSAATKSSSSSSNNNDSNSSSSSSKQYDMVILVRNNANKSQYGKYSSATPGRHIFITPNECMVHSDALLTLCVASVLHRKRDQNTEHPTDSMQVVDLAQLPLKFLAGFSSHPLAHRVNFLRADACDESGIKWSRFLEPFTKAAKKNKQFQVQLEGPLYNEFAQSVQDLDYNSAAKMCAPLQTLLQELESVVLLALPHNGLLPQENQYISVTLDAQSRDRVAALASGEPGAPVQQPHVTLVHSLDTKQSEHLARWYKALETALDREVQVTVRKYKRCKGKLVAAEAVVDSDLAALVSSGVPHITLKVQKGSKAVEARDVLLDDTVPFIQLDEPLQLVGRVCLVSSKF